MSETTTEPILRRTVTPRDKIITLAVLICSVIVAIFSHWFATWPEPTGLKWAMVGLTIGEIVSFVGIWFVLVLLTRHFVVNSEKMTLGKWLLLLIVYIAISLVLIIGFISFNNLSEPYRQQAKVWSLCQDEGISTNECAGMIANLATEDNR